MKYGEDTTQSPREGISSTRLLLLLLLFDNIYATGRRTQADDIILL